MTRPFAWPAVLAISGILWTPSAMAGSPRCSVISPGGCQRGAEMELAFRGSNLEDATGVLFDEPGLQAEVVKAEKGRVLMKVKAAADVRLGEHRCRVVTASGISDVRLIYVTPFPMVQEIEDKKAPDSAQPIALGTTVYGQVQNEDVDRFEVELKKGQRLGVEVVAVRLQTQTLNDTLISITKADGSKIAEIDDATFTQQDPVTSIVAPEDGKYVVSIKDSTNSGQGDAQYLLNIGTFPRPVAVYPPGGKVGEDLKVQLIGDASGVIEKSFKLPDQPRDQFELFSEDAQPTPQPNLVRVSAFPNVLEVEPNNDVAQTPSAGIEPPFALNGILQEAGDVDGFRFTAKKGQDLDFNVYARRLRSPLDSVLSIYDLKGNRLATNDDAGQPDSYLRWKAPVDGEFVVSISDQLKRGGPTFTYRIEVTAPQPRLGLWFPEMVINQNQERRAVVVPRGNRYATLVRAKRTDFAGSIEVASADLPQGVSAKSMLMDKSVDTVPMVFEAAADAPLTAKVFHLDGKWTDAPEGAAIKTEIDHMVDIVENGNQKSYYSLRERALPVNVSKEIPVKLHLEQPKVSVLQAGSIGLKVKAERKDDFKGPISLSLLYVPTGLGTAGTVQIKEGESEAVYTVSANGNAAPRKWQICVVGSADFGAGPVWMSTELIDIEVAEPYVAGKIGRSFVDQGDSTTITVQLEQKRPFEGKAKLSLLGLPPNATAEDKEITKDTTEVQFTVKAGENTPAATHKQLFCQFQLTQEGEEMNTAFANGGILRVDKASLAKKEDPKK